MSATHLVRRFVGSLRPGPPRVEDERWAAELLTAEELPLYRRLPNHDRRHAVQVAHRAESALGPDCEARWLAAAMLHDVGKYDAGLSVPGRAIATLVAAGPAGASRVDRWEPRSGLRRKIARIRARHGEIGAEEIRAAGGREEAALWSAAHHHPETWTTLAIPPSVVRVLDAADQT